IQFEFHYNEINMLYLKYEQLIKQFGNQIYNNNSQLIIPKRSRNKVKELNIEFTPDKTVKLSIMDKTSNLSLCSIFLNIGTFNSIFELNKQIRNNYLQITSNLMINTNIEKLSFENKNDFSNLNNLIQDSSNEFNKRISQLNVIV